MWSFILKRLGATLVTLVAASVIIFAFIHLIPGDPIYIMLGDMATPEQAEAVRHSLGPRPADPGPVPALGRRGAAGRSGTFDLL